MEEIQNEIESRTYSELKNDTDSFANAIESLAKRAAYRCNRPFII